MDIPKEVRDYALEIKHPVGLVGCRTTAISLDCCEYDLAVFSPEPFPPTLNKIGGQFVEMVHMSGSALSAELFDIQMLNTPDRMFQSPSADREESRARNLWALGRKSLARSLMLQIRSQRAEKQPVIASAWLKAAAYSFLQGILQMARVMPMPAHELGLLRGLSQQTLAATDLVPAFDVVGVERATANSVLRSEKACSAILNKRYDRELVLSKAATLREKQMIADSYYYIGRAVCSAMIDGEESVLRYPKVLQVALDLSADASHLEKKRELLFQAAASALKREFATKIK